MAFNITEYVRSCVNDYKRFVGFYSYDLRIFSLKYEMLLREIALNH